MKLSGKLSESRNECSETWSEWQDLNLRPPRPERGAHRPFGATIAKEIRRFRGSETARFLVAPIDFVGLSHSLHSCQTNPLSVRITLRAHMPRLLGCNGAQCPVRLRLRIDS